MQQRCPRKVEEEVARVPRKVEEVPLEGRAREGKVCELFSVLH